MAEDDFLKQRERFFFLLGYAITRWAYIDRSLFNFCKFALNATEHKTAIVFHRTPSIGDHLALTDALMRAAQLQPQDLKHWEQIVHVMGKLLPFRNDIAHNPPVQAVSMKIMVNKHDPSKSHIADQKQQWEIRTEPTKLLHQSKNRKTRKINATSESIVAHLKKVEKLEHAISALSWKVLGRPPGLGPAVLAPAFPQDLDSD
jgi:hypothetical protein